MMITQNKVAQNAAHFLENLWPELQELIEQWPTLPEALKASILAMLRTVKA